MHQKTRNFNANLMQLVPDRYNYQVTRNCNFSDQNGQSCQEICKCNNFHLFTINGHKFSLKMVYFIYPSRFQGHLNYFHNIVAKLCSKDHQSCQEPETLIVGHFFQKKLLDLCEMS